MRFLSESNGGTIGFPNLGIGDFNPPDGIPLFGIEIKFYGIIIALGLLLAVLYCMRRAKQFGITSDDILDIVLVGTPCGVIGARLYYVLSKGESIDQWINIRGGGLAIYGGVIGAVGSVVIFCLLSKKRRRKLLPCMDIAGIGFLIGQAIGRWGNFFNREAFGDYSDGLFAMRLSADRLNALALADSAQKTMLQEKMVDGFIQVHPTFLYESAWNTVGFVLLHFLSKKRKFDGQVFLYYLVWYGLGRFYIEGLRTDSLMLGSFRISQLLAGVTCLLALAILIYMLMIKRPTGERMLVNRVAAKAAEIEQENESEEAEPVEQTDSADEIETNEQEEEA
ncbi:MAG: prolipoprotein diacylglyceryl transferase [Ruminococcaceae bacterium]|nr:prolipoprotein diacylglyceryl transferase [Oscillospiraceae bacterium]